MYEAIHVECTNLRLRNTIGALLTAVALIALAGSSKKALVEALEMKRPIKPPFASEEPKTSDGDASCSSPGRCRPIRAAARGLRVRLHLPFMLKPFHFLPRLQSPYAIDLFLQHDGGKDCASCRLKSASSLPLVLVALLTIFDLVLLP